jgi:hypothetical protein
MFTTERESERLAIHLTIWRLNWGAGTSWMNGHLFMEVAKAFCVPPRWHFESVLFQPSSGD